MSGTRAGQRAVPQADTKGDEKERAAPSQNSPSLQTD